MYQDVGVGQTSKNIVNRQVFCAVFYGQSIVSATFFEYGLQNQNYTITVFENTDRIKMSNLRTKPFAPKSGNRCHFWGVLAPCDRNERKSERLLKQRTGQCTLAIRLCEKNSSLTFNLNNPVFHKILLYKMQQSLFGFGNSFL